MDKKLIRENIFDKTSEAQISLLNLFLNFSYIYLGITKKPKVKLQFNKDIIQTTANYGNGIVNVYAKDRALVDIMRSIAHELTHYKQDIENRLQPDKHTENNKAGSEIENEANAMAGEIIRNFGEEHPEIYE